MAMLLFHVLLLYVILATQLNGATAHLSTFF